MDRREFLNVLAAGVAAGLPLASRQALAQGSAAAAMYDVAPFGNVSLLHITDCHAQLLPTYYREPSVNLGFGASAGRPPHLVGEALLKHFGIKPGTSTRTRSRISTYVAAARTYGKVGGFAHLATLVKRLKASRPHALLARRRRHVAGVGHRALDEGPGHGRRGQAPRRRRDDRSLGVHARCRARDRKSWPRTSPARSSFSPRT